MYENRKESGQLVNVPMELGESEMGTGWPVSAGMCRRYPWGVTPTVDASRFGLMLSQAQTGGPDGAERSARVRGPEVVAA